MVKKTTLKEVGEMLTHIVDHMLTKEDVSEIVDARLDEKLEPIQETLDAHTRRLSTIENNQNSDLDKRKLLEVRVTKIEKELTSLKH